MKSELMAAALLAVSIMAAGTPAHAAPAKKTLIVYYSWGGNTRVVAEQIKEATGADLFEIVPVKPYPTAYRQTTEQAKREINADFRPEIRGKVANMASYDVIILGSPCWWGTVAPAVMTFLESYDLSGKTIAPFMTHEGSRMGHSESDIKRLAPRSTLLGGLPIRGGSVREAKDDVIRWLRGKGLLN